MIAHDRIDGPSLGKLIRLAREARGWSRTKLAWEAERIREPILARAGISAPPLDNLVVECVESRRVTIRLNDRKEPIPYVMRALGMDPRAILEALGWEG